MLSYWNVLLFIRYTYVLLLLLLLLWLNIFIFSYYLTTSNAETWCINCYRLASKDYIIQTPKGNQWEETILQDMLHILCEIVVWKYEYSNSKCKECIWFDFDFEKPLKKVL